MSLLFEDLFKKFNSDLKILVKKGLTRTNKSSVFDVTTAMSPKTITQVGCLCLCLCLCFKLMGMVISVYVKFCVEFSPISDTVQGMVSTISSGNWNLQRFKMERAGEIVCILCTYFLHERV
jgi:uncharacterized membrane protein